MTTWYLVGLPAWIALLLTAGARLADMGRDQWTRIDHVRRLGYIGTAVVASVMLAIPFSADWSLYAVSTWRGNVLAWCIAVVLPWSVTLVWVATREELPWWDMILGVHRRTDEWAAHGARARIRLELNAITDSFRPRRYRKPLAGPKGPLP